MVAVFACANCPRVGGKLAIHGEDSLRVNGAGFSSLCYLSVPERAKSVGLVRERLADQNPVSIIADSVEELIASLWLVSGAGSDLSPGLQPLLSSALYVAHFFLSEE